MKKKQSERDMSGASLPEAAARAGAGVAVKNKGRAVGEPFREKHDEVPESQCRGVRGERRGVVAA